ncbi:hypothetical protein DA718_00770 [Klebsiella huaxiensis]|nr:hypothetical protein DA718_00770 [Klebsiella huaxiensis]
MAPRQASQPGHRIVLYTLSFKLSLCWLRSLTPVTYLCKLRGFTPLPPQYNLNDFVYTRTLDCQAQMPNPRFSKVA